MLPIAPDTLLQQRYQILNLIGEGKFGRTYLAVDLGRAEAYCAIEEVAPFSQFSSVVVQAKELFKQEVTPLYQLQHLQIPRFWTTFEEQNRLLLVRDYIIGKTYQDILADRRDLGTTFSEVEVWRFLLQILPVISYLHNKGTIHRDLSPAHIICRDSDHLPVPIDFGIVKEFANKLQVDIASQRIVVGQPGYAPIEQIKSGQVYPNSDLYALAVTAVVLLTGKEPSALFAGDTPAERLHQQMNWSWRRWTQIDDSFANILSRMLSPQPADRYQSASEVERDLQAITSLNSQRVETSEIQSDSPAPRPTVAVGPKSKNTFSMSSRVQTAITNLNIRSIWEKPQVFIPSGILIALLAGVGSWMGVTQLLHRDLPEPVVSTTPPKQIDFNNPTIPTDTETTTTSTTGDLIQPEMERSIEKEGTVDVNTPVRYRISAIAGQNLDIQLVPPTPKNADASKTSLPINPITATTGAVTPNPTQPKNPTQKNSPVPVAVPIAPTQVLMTILSPLGTPMDDNSERVVGWRGQISSSGDYTIELRPIKGLAGSTFPYKLSVTQLAVTPVNIAPVEKNSPGVESTAPLGIPIPIGGNGLNAIPAGPKTTIPTKNFPTFSPPVPVPIEVPQTRPNTTPTEAERPTRKRRRNRNSEDTPQVKQRERVDSDNETPTPRRRRNRVKSSEEATPTPRSQRTRQTEPTPKPEPSPATSPDPVENGTNSNKKPEPEIQIPILVPDAKNTTPPPEKTGGNQKTPPAGTLTDPD
jgi:serine/threonine protein kinase